MSNDFDPRVILETLERHGVLYLLVGGMAGRAHGAERLTTDIDCVPGNDRENLERLAAALKELGARLRVGGMTDEEAQALPVVLDALTLENFGSSTWMTNHGPVDILSGLKAENGDTVDYTELEPRKVTHRISGVTVDVAALDDIIAAKAFAGRPKGPC